MLIPFSDAARADLREIGAKAHTLAVLADHGFAVPPGGVLPATVLWEAIRSAGVDATLRVAIADAAAASPTELPARCDAIRALVTALPIDEQPARQIAAAVAALPGESVSVRSSSSVEDGAERSFAGLHDTVLDVRPADVLDAIRTVWASAWSPRAISVLRAHGLDPHAVRMGVVIQAFVSAEAAGVVLTGDPTTGSRDLITVSAVPGPGEGLVSGRLTPTRVLVRRAPAEVLHREAGADDTAATVLSDAAALDLAQTARRIETVLGGRHQDIEWARVGERTSILQARPMIVRPPDERARWRPPIPDSNWRSGWRMGEWLPDPVTPLFASWVLPRMVAAREQGGTGVFGWALTSLIQVTAPWFVLLDGYVFRRMDSTAKLRPLGKIPPPQPIDTDGTRRMLADYARHFDAVHAGFDVRAATDLELYRRVTRLVEEAGDLWCLISDVGGFAREQRRFEPAYTRWVDLPDRPPFTVFFGGYGSRPVDGQQALYEMAGALRDAGITPGPTLSTEALTPAQLERIDVWLAEYGHQVDTLDLHRPPLDRSVVLALLRPLLEADDPVSPRARVAAAARARDRAMARVTAALRDAPDRLAEFLAHVQGFQARAALREDVMFAFQMGWPVMRRVVDALAQRLVDAGHFAAPELIHFLDHDELHDVLTGAAPTVALQGVLTRRRAAWRAKHALRPPKLVGRERAGGPSTGKGMAADGTRIVGDPASAGRARGPVCIVRGAADIARVRPGDVLVVHTATPGLAPAMLVASALVADTGGGSSHSSLLAREFGLPAVVNTIEAVVTLRPGQIVDVDGSRGVVDLVSPARSG